MTCVAFNGMSPNHDTCPTFGHGDYGGTSDRKKWTGNIWKALSEGIVKWRKVVGDRLPGASPVPEHVKTAFQQSIRPPLDRAPNDFDHLGYATASKRVVTSSNATLSPLALGAVGEMIATAEQATSGSTLHFVGIGGSRLYGYPAQLDAHWQGALRNGASALSKDLLTSIDTGLLHHKGITTMAHAVEDKDKSKGDTYHAAATLTNVETMLTIRLNLVKLERMLYGPTYEVNKFILASMLIRTDHPADGQPSGLRAARLRSSDGVVLDSGREE
jgi:hypothetical protein